MSAFDQIGAECNRIAKAADELRDAAFQVLSLLADAEPPHACPACKHPCDEHVGRWCRVTTGAVNARGQALICCCEAVDPDPAIQPRPNPSAEEASE